MEVERRTITGNELFWGDVYPTPSQIDLINKSPTLVDNLSEYGDASDVGSMRTDAGHLTFFDGTNIVLGQKNTQSDNDFIAALSHELGHFTNRSNDATFNHTQYLLNPRDPNAYNVEAMKGLHAEGEAIYNNWKIQQEILQNSQTPTSPGIEISLSPKGTRQKFDKQHATDVENGMSETQDRNKLIPIGMEAYALAPPSSTPDSTYYATYGSRSGGRPTEEGNPTSIDFGSDNNGNITSMTETWGSGDTGTQIFSEGQIRSSTLVNKNGQPISSALYTQNPSGGYNVNVTNGEGQLTNRYEFNKDHSGVEHQYQPDGSHTDTLFNTNNRTKQLTAFDTQGRQFQTDYFDPQWGENTNRTLTTPNGGHIEYSFNDRGKVGLQVDFDAKGHRTAMNHYDPDTGRVDTAVRYGYGNERTVYGLDANGKATYYNVDKDGKQSAIYPLDTSATSSMDYLARDASKITPMETQKVPTSAGGEMRQPLGTENGIDHPDSASTDNLSRPENKATGDDELPPATNTASDGSGRETTSDDTDLSRAAIETNNARDEEKLPPGANAASDENDRESASNNSEDGYRENAESADNGSS